MAGRLHRLVYVSRWANVLGEDGDAAVCRIVAASMGKNRLMDVTGLLLAHEGWFIQALEGPEAGVAALMSTILRDPRHRSVRVLSEGEAEGRMFQDWNMVGARLSPEADPLLVELGQIARFDGYRLDDHGALHLLLYAAEARRRRERTNLGLDRLAS